jgi:cytochrome P450
VSNMSPTPRPRFDAFQPFVQSQLDDPYPVLARARTEQPVFYVSELDFWVVTRYEDVNRIYGQPGIFSNAAVLTPRLDVPDEIRRDFGDRQLPLAHQLVMTDPPQHTRLKQLMTPAFMPSRINTREAWIRQYTNTLIDGFIADRTADLVTQYAVKIPPAVIGKIVGAPESDAQQFAGWVDDIFTLTGAWDVPEDQRAAAWRGVFAFEDYIRQLIADRRQRPHDDLTTDFIQAVTDDGSPAMSDIEVLHNVVNVAAAGADTTGVLISQLLHLLLTHPKQLQAIRSDRSLVANAVHEAMRFRAPVRGLMRKTTTDATIGGVVIPAGAMVFISLASANRDASVFDAPDEFDVCRSAAFKNLGFGSRSHACIGANLARLEARVAVETLFDRLPDLVLLDGQVTMRYRPNLMLPAFKSLRVRW